jgi:two-component system CheB/CheR fusion protein
VNDRYVKLTRSYLVAAACVGTALLLRLVADPWLKGTFPRTLLYTATALAARYGGVGPGILAALAGYLASTYLFLSPTDPYEQGPMGPQTAVGIFAYFACCAIISTLAGGLRRAQRRAADDTLALRLQQQHLQFENQHRAAAEESAQQANRQLTGQLEEYARAETALRASEERFRVALESSAVPFAILRAVRAADGRITDFVWDYVNSAAARVISVPATELIGRRIAEMFPWSWEVPGLFASYCRAVETGEPQTIEVQATTGEDSWFHNIATRFGDGVAVWFADVSANRRAERAVRDARAQLQTITDLMPSGVTRCSRDMRYVWVNRQFAEWIDRPVDEIVGQPIRAVIGKAFETFAPYYREVLTGARVEHEEEVEFARSGPHWISGVYVPVFAANGSVDGWVAVITDITQRKHLELALLEADRRKDEFLAVLAHELRNPLAPMRNALEYLRLQAPEDANLNHARDIIDRQLTHMSRLVDDLLDLSRVTQGRIQLQRARVAVGVVVGHAVEASRPLIDAAGHQLSVHLPPQPAFVYADVTRLAQAIANLLNNAAKYTPRGGHITLTVTHQPEEVVIEVADSGVGIPHHMLAHIFDMFVQVDRSLDRTQGGLGIGLTLVKRLVEMHGGSVEAESGGVGQGSSFRMRLPRMAEAEVEAWSPPVDFEALSAAHRRVLVVDDNVDAAESLSMLLSALGHETRVAHDGVEALAAMAPFHPQIVLLDIGLPHMNGYEVARRIRRQFTNGGPQLIALTGWGQEEDRRQAREAGFDYHLTKPVDLSALLELMSQSRAEV